MLVHCLYASRPAVPFSPLVMKSIQDQSRKNNPRQGITGILCFTEDLFIQVLEGGRDEVCALFARIVRDDRHIAVRTLVYDEISQRRFGSWTMGRVDISKINPGLLLKYSEKPVFDPFACSGKITMALLDELVATASIVNRNS